MNTQPLYPTQPPYPNQTNVAPGPYPQSPPPPQYPYPTAPYPMDKQSQPPYQYPNPPAPYPVDTQSPQPPQYSNPPAMGAMYYPQGQPTPAYPPQQQQQQQQSVVVVGAANPTPVIVQPQIPIESYGGYQVFACIVLWFCNWVFGLIAWILALTADNTKFTDRDQARRLGKASLGMSISGIIVTVIIVAIAVGVSLGTTRSYYSYSSSCLYTAGNGRCYSSSRYVGSSCYNTFSTCCKYYEDFYYAYSCYTT